MAQGDSTRPGGPTPAVRASMLSRIPLLKSLVRTTVTVRPEHAALAKAAGFADFESVWSLESSRPAATHRDRHAVEVSVDAPSRRDFFLKRLGRARAKHLLEALAAFEKPISKCRREWEFGQALERIGVRVAPLVSFGERSIGFWPLDSFLVVERVYGAEPLDAFLESLSQLPAAERYAETRGLTAALAETISKMHSAGFFHRDLYAKHVFVRRNGGGFAINIIDLQRMRKDCGTRAIAQDFAATNVTIPATVAPLRARLRFLREYLRRRAENEGRNAAAARLGLREIAEAVLARSLRIAGRSKFKGIQWLRRD